MRRAVAIRASSLDSTGSGAVSRSAAGNSQGGFETELGSTGSAYRDNSSLTKPSMADISLLVSGWTSGTTSCWSGGLSWTGLSSATAVAVDSTAGGSEVGTGVDAGMLGCSVSFVRDFSLCAMAPLNRFRSGCSATNRALWPTCSKARAYKGPTLLGNTTTGIKTAIITNLAMPNDRGAPPKIVPHRPPRLTSAKIPKPGWKKERTPTAMAAPAAAVTHHCH